jgi:transcriptional regulator with XRE-family HTH domain
MNSKKDETLGQLLSRAFESSGWSKAELARRTGFSPTYVDNILNDKSPGTRSGVARHVPKETVDKFAKALNVPLKEARLAAGLAPPEGEVISPKMIESETEVFSPTFLTAHELAHVQILRKLPEAKRVEVQKLTLELYQKEIEPTSPSVRATENATDDDGDVEFLGYEEQLPEPSISDKRKKKESA